jgi:signal transduction histidine kinase
MALRPPWAGVSRGSARLRLTLLYSGMFLLLGTLVVVIIFLFTSVGTVVHGSSVAVAKPGPSGGTVGPVGKLIGPDVGGEQHSLDQGRLLTASWLVLILTAIGSTVLGWFIAGRVLRPLRQMTETAHTISARNLGERLALSGPDDEFKRLGDTFDELLGRLQAAFEAQRRFVANAAHELRTPLTVDRTLLQVALANPDAGTEQLRATCEELLASGRGQERLLEALLTLASSERGVERSEPLDLAVLAGRAAGGDRAGRVRMTLSSAPTSGDPALVERLIGNLLDNAVRHNDSRGVVEVSTGVDREWSYLTVSNTGPVVPAWALERLFEPFGRMEEHRRAESGEHHGLGLSIVRSIANAHHAEVEARPRDEGGLGVTVRFPRSEE